jgi:single-strand DNA-binding protein
MKGYSHVTIAGNVTADPTERIVGEWHFTTVVVAVNSSYVKDGVKKERAAFIEVKFAKRGMEHPIFRFVKKGDPILVSGRLDQESWETKDGQRRSKLLVHGSDFLFLPKGDGGGSGYPSRWTPTDTIPDSDVPF